MPYRSFLPRQRQRQKPRRFLRMIWIIPAVVVLAVVGVFFIFSGFGGEKAELPGAPAAEPPKPEKVRVEGRYLFAGTTVWARRMQAWSTRADGTVDYAYPFSGLDTFEREKYDAWLADLECPVLSQEISVATQISETAFNCRPEFLPEAAKYFDFFNLANNHTRDFNGEAALAETRRHLEENGIQHFGDFEPAKLADICEVVAMPVRVISELNGQETAEPGHLPVALCGWHYFFRLPSSGEIEHMRQYAEVMPVFAFIQAGAEYRPHADELQISMVHRIMDQGPEFVVGNSAHWVQNGEVYQGKPILYATGNFIFDQQQNAELTRSASMDARMSIPYSGNLEQWLELGASCKAHKDTCFEQIKQGRFTQLDPQFTYDIVAGDSSNQLTKRAGSAIQQAVEERVGWPAMRAALGQE
jgi:poly-gamma-glutamate synthesis protein (capsule biosynthesis protein)